MRNSVYFKRLALTLLSLCTLLSLAACASKGETTTAPVPQTTTEEAKEDIDLERIENVYIKNIEDVFNTTFADFCPSTMIAGNSVWFMTTVNLTREQYTEVLKRENLLEMHKTIVQGALDLGATFIHDLREIYSDKTFVFEMGFADGTQMILINDDQVIFDIAEYLGLY